MTDLERRYEDLMRNVDQRTRDAIENPAYPINPGDEFHIKRRLAFTELCRLGLRIWNVRV
jgi:hypothetical protein